MLLRHDYSEKSYLDIQVSKFHSVHILGVYLNFFFSWSHLKLPPDKNFTHQIASYHMFLTNAPKYGIIIETGGVGWSIAQYFLWYNDFYFG